MKRMLVLLLFVLSTDPNTGEVKQKVKISDKGAAALDKGAGAAEGFAPLLALLGPLGAGAASALLAAAATWRKMKPALTTAKTEAQQYHAVAQTSVTALEELKKLNMEDWEKLKPAIEDSLKRYGIDPLKLENVIRGMRGLPPIPSIA